MPRALLVSFLCSETLQTGPNGSSSGTEAKARAVRASSQRQEVTSSLTLDEKIFQAGSKRWVASRHKSILDARLTHIMACMHTCRQHARKRRMYILQPGERVPAALENCLQHRWHSDFGNELWKDDSENRPNGTGAESQATGYFAIVS